MKDKQKDQAVLAAIGGMHTQFGVCAPEIRREMRHKIPETQIERALRRLTKRGTMQVDKRLFLAKARRQGASRLVYNMLFIRATYTHYVPV